MECANYDFQVIGFDTNEVLIENLRLKISHVEGVNSLDLEKAIYSNKYFPSCDETDLKDCEIFVICVPTPLSSNKKPELSYVKLASEIIGRVANDETLIINESTSYPGTLRNLIAPIVESLSGRKHHFAISPERVDPGNTKFHIKTTPRIISGITPLASKLARDFYQNFCSEVIEVSTPEIAEAAKLFENTFRQVNIALVNELAQVMSELEIPIEEVLDAAATKPYGFMKFNPTIGVGGHCIPIDPIYLMAAANQTGMDFNFIKLSDKINSGMPSYVVQKIKNLHGGSIANFNILIVGVSYKSNVSDTRESPADSAYSEFRKLGCNVYWFDPLVSKWRDGKVTTLDAGAFDIVLICQIHESMKIDDILNSGKFVFDASGRGISKYKI